MASHSSTPAWKIPWTEEPGRLQSMVSLRVGHNWVTSLSLFTFMHWRRKWQPTPVFLPGESQGRGSLVGCRLWGHTESDTTEVLAAAASRKEKRPSFWWYKSGTCGLRQTIEATTFWFLNYGKSSVTLELAGGIPASWFSRFQTVAEMVLKTRWFSGWYSGGHSWRPSPELLLIMSILFLASHPFLFKWLNLFLFASKSCLI